MTYNKFINKTIDASVGVLQDLIFSEQNTNADGLLQKLDARIKIISFLIFIISVIYIKHISIMVIAYLICLILVKLSAIKYTFFLKRTLFFIPLFSFFIALPSIFDFVTPGETVIQIGWLKVTRQGIFTASIFILRVTVSVSFLILLSLTTRHSEILKALFVLGIPDIFIIIAGMCYRYIYLMAEILKNTFLAIKSRTYNKITIWYGQKITAWNIALLWNRSYNLYEQIYKAMQARGFIGKPVSIKNFKLKFADFLWILIICIISGILLFTDNLIKGI